MPQKTPRFYKATTSIASDGFDFVPGRIYRALEDLESVDRLVEGGLLRELSGPPSPENEDRVITILPQWFDPPRQPPMREPLLEAPEVAERLGVTVEHFDELRSSTDFPVPSLHVWHPRDDGGVDRRAQWRWSKVEQWLARQQAGAELAQKVGLFSKLRTSAAAVVGGRR